MVTVEKVDLSNKTQVNEFIKFPFKLYANTPQWVPLFDMDMRIVMDPKKHPFYEHSDAEFFVAKRGDEVVGRICAMENKLFNKYHGKKEGEFYFFDTINDQEVADALFNRVFEWDKARGLDALIGPKGFSSFDGYGIQIEGNDLPQMMTMMNYNFPYYQTLVENLGFTKEVDFISCYADSKNFTLDPRISLIAEKVLQKGKFAVKNFKNKAEIRAWAERIGEAYNNTFVNNWEYYPLTEKEVKFVLDTLITSIVPKLMKIITYEDTVVGFLLAFPDISKALQRAKGKITPWSIADIMISLKRAKTVSVNGMGVLPEYHGRGGNALLYTEMQKTIVESGFDHAELTQVANTAEQMRKDLINLGGKPYKNHRVYRRAV
jgi:hypothetical protein